MGDSAARPRLAACLVCRRSKIKCDWAPSQSRCKRCTQLGRDCIRPDVHVGRQKGIKNKRVGLEKALFQVEQAVKRAAVNGGGGQTPEERNIVIRLRELLEEAQSGSRLGHRQASRGSLSASVTAADAAGYDDDMDEDSSGDEDIDEASNIDSTPELGRLNEDPLAVDDAENPLQLLARASYFQPPEEPRVPMPQPPIAAVMHSHATPPVTVTAASGGGGIGVGGGGRLSKDLHGFFAPARVNLDIGDDVDPISLGLATMEEAEAAFNFFYDKLAHTRWGLDPRIYTLSFTRSRSAFLCTSIMAASALFWPSASALSKRLSNHGKMLADRIISHRYKSVEVVLALLINVPWMFPGTQSTSDETCAYVSMANTIAIDLSLHKMVASSESLGPGSGMTIARGECIDPKAALAMDGFPDVDPASERGILLLRSRERCWISLFVLERGMCLARGRPFLVPITRFLKDCDDWHNSPLAEVQDGHLLSMAVLRRDLDGLFATVRALCDGSQALTSDGSLTAQSIESTIEQFFDQWYTKWGGSIGAGTEPRLPPYVDILVTHLRLSIYGSVINHPTAPLEVRRFFRTAGLSASVNVMRTAIQGESQLQSMPNNTTIMISFAACFALTLSAYAAGGSALAPSVRKLIDEVAGCLERIGAVTPHRNGLSMLYGKHLRQIVRRAARSGHRGAAKVRSPATVASSSASASMGTPIDTAERAAAMAATASAPSMPSSSSQRHAHPMDQQLLWPETLQFSTMSDDQIMQVLNQPGNDFEPTFDGLSWDDMNNFDWLHWPEFGS